MSESPPNPRPKGLQRGLYAAAWASEQLGAVAESLAHPVAVFRRSLIDEGVPDDAADRLAAEFLALLLRDVTTP